jgi:hypothetical protein
MIISMNATVCGDMNHGEKRQHKIVSSNAAQMSVANESEPLPARLSHLRISAIQLEPSSIRSQWTCQILT